MAKDGQPTEPASEGRLLNNDDTFRLMFENNPLPMWVYDRETLAFLAVNEAAVRHYGYSREQFLGMTIKNIRPACDVPHLVQHTGRSRSDLHQAGHWRHRKQDGTLIDVEIITHDLRFNQRPARLVLVYDITERKRAERALRESERRLELFFSQSLDGFFFMMLDTPVRWDETVNKDQVLEYVFAHQRLTKVNDALLAQYGATRNALLGLTPADLFQHDIPYGKAVWRRFFDAGRLHVETEERKLDGSVLWIEGDYICLYDQDGRITGHFGIQRDISERKRAEEALRRSHLELESKIMERTATLEAEIRERKRAESKLREAKEVAEAANRAKSEFLANMSHELRTPLNSVLGYAQILRQHGTLLPKQRKALSIIEQSGEHLLGLINEILDLAKIEAGTLELNPSKVSLPQLLQNVVDSMRARAQGKGLSFSSEWLSEIPYSIKADERRLRQVLMNLIDNAIKYTREGGVALRVGYHGGRLRFLVEDTGVGIRPEHLEEIFRIFHQVRDTGSVEEGTGLGLAICQRLVNLMGGELKVSSIPGKGSRFWFDVELAVIADVNGETNLGSRAIVGIDAKQRKVLVVDDRDDNRSLLLDMLVPLGFEVHEAQDGNTCLRQAARLRPDAILVDLRMPNMSGEEVIRRLRAVPEVREAIIIAISASAFEHNREQCIEAGADDFLSKPIRADKLMTLLSRFLGLELRFEGEPPCEPSGAKRGASPTILPAEQWESLAELARRGDIKDLRERAEQLSQLDERYQPFANELQTLAERFQIKQIRRLLEATRRGT